MFMCLTGKRGTGKSLTAAKMARERLVAGGKVWANFHLDFSKFPTKIPIENCFFADDINDLAYMRSGLFLFDEAHWKLSSREWKNMAPETHQYLALSRHIDMDIVLVSQDFARLDTIVRELTEFVRELHRIGRLHWYRDFEPDDVNLKTRKSHGLLPKFFWRNNHDSLTYDTKELYGALLKKLPPKKFRANGTAEAPPI